MYCRGLAHMWKARRPPLCDTGSGIVNSSSWFRDIRIDHDLFGTNKYYPLIIEIVNSWLSKPKINYGELDVSFNQLLLQMIYRLCSLDSLTILSCKKFSKFLAVRCSMCTKNLR